MPCLHQKFERLVSAFPTLSRYSDSRGRTTSSSELSESPSSHWFWDWFSLVTGVVSFLFIIVVICLTLGTECRGSFTELDRPSGGEDLRAGFGWGSAELISPEVGMDDEGAFGGMRLKSCGGRWFSLVAKGGFGFLVTRIRLWYPMSSSRRWPQWGILPSIHPSTMHPWVDPSFLYRIGGTSSSSLLERWLWEY